MSLVTPTTLACQVDGLQTVYTYNNTNAFFAFNE